MPQSFPPDWRSNSNDAPNTNHYNHHHQQHNNHHHNHHNSSGTWNNPNNLQNAAKDTSNQPVLQNANGKKYSPAEMLEMWNQMNSLNHFKSTGRSRSDLYYSAMPNQPANVMAEKKDATDPVVNQTSSLGAADFLLSGGGGGSNGVVSGSKHVNAMTPAAVPTTSAWNAFGTTSPRVMTPGGDVSLMGKGLFEASSSGATPPPPPPPPPGLASLLGPDQINWMYKDPTGREYGPFSGRMMNDWYVGGWLRESLMIRRAEEVEYYSLGSFKERVGNGMQPFLIPLPPVSSSANSSQPSSPADPFARMRQQPLANQFAALQLQQQQQQQQPQQWVPAPVSPWAQSQSPFFSQPQPSPQSQPQPVQSPLFGLNGVSQPSDPVWNGSNQPPAYPINQPEQQSIAAPASPAPGDPIRPIEPKAPSPQKEEEPVVKEPVAAPVTPSKKQKKKNKASPATVPAPVPEPETVAKEPSETLVPDESEEPQSPATPSVAPWAKNVQQTPQKKPSAPSLREIQEREAAERKKQQAVQAQQQQSALLQQAAMLQSQAAKATGPALPTSANWASAGSSAQPVKTLAQIQQEEAAAASKKKATPASTVPTVASIAKGGAPGLTRSASPPSTGSGSSAWTTVGPGGRKVGGGVPAAVTASPTAVPSVKRTTTSSSSSSATPVKKPVTATAAVPAANTNGDDFLYWCKSTITDLNQGVNANEMLSMMLSMPAIPESKEIIAETIYASSSTMDGRRFAEEFIKRRAKADSENKTGESWSDALQRQAAAGPANDGWNASFKVVTKKKNRKT